MILYGFEDNADEGEHSCHVHPLGAAEVVRYWCGHTCQDALCLRYKVVWMVTHPRAVVRHLRGLNYDGISR